MLGAQRKIENVKKDSKNPHFKSTYASLGAVLDAVKPILNEFDLVLTQEIRSGAPDGNVRVTTRIVHAPSGEQTCDSQTIPVSKNDPQGHGSAITYARRYAIQALLAIASEDDDGNEASKKNGTPKPVDPVPVTTFKKPEPASTKAVEDITAKLSKSLPGFKIRNPNDS